MARHGRRCARTGATLRGARGRGGADYREGRVRRSSTLRASIGGQPALGWACVLIGVALLMPFILGYTVFVYYTFRGKVRADEGYH